MYFAKKRKRGYPFVQRIYPSNTFLSLFTGVRMGELLALTWEDVDEKKMTIQINHNLVRVTTYDEAGKKNGTELIVQTPKTKKSHRIIPVQEDMFRLLMQEKRKQEDAEKENPPIFNPLKLVFPSTVSTHTDPRTYQKCVAKVSKRCEILHVNVHALRHNCKHFVNYTECKSLTDVYKQLYHQLQ